MDRRLTGVEARGFGLAPMPPGDHEQDRGGGESEWDEERALFEEFLGVGHLKAVIAESVEVQDEKDGEVGASGEIRAGERNPVERREDELHEKRAGGKLKDGVERDAPAAPDGDFGGEQEEEGKRQSAGEDAFAPRGNKFPITAPAPPRAIIAGS